MTLQAFSRQIWNHWNLIWQRYCTSTMVQSVSSHSNLQPSEVCEKVFVWISKAAFFIIFFDGFFGGFYWPMSNLYTIIQLQPVMIHRSFRESSGTNDLGGWFGTLHWSLLLRRLLPGGGWQDAGFVDKIKTKNGCMILPGWFWWWTICGFFQGLLQDRLLWGYERCWSGDPF